MKECFITKRFNGSSKSVLEFISKALDKNSAEGYSVTLRQMFYLAVNANVMENEEREYKRLCSIVSDARLAGLIDWESFPDMMRQTRIVETFSNTASFLNTIDEQYYEDLWKYQKNHVEVWVEKDGLIGTLERTCKLYRVPLFVSRGFSSHHSMYEASLRLRNKIKKGKQVILLQVGDFDRNGLLMSEDSIKRIRMFAKSDAIDSVRVCLNEDQIRYYNVPKDPRSTSREDRWEVDAIDPASLNRLVMSSIAYYGEGELFTKATAQESANRQALRSNLQSLI